MLEQISNVAFEGQLDLSQNKEIETRFVFELYIELKRRVDSLQLAIAARHTRAVFALHEV